jgi:hypothetical protein
MISFVVGTRCCEHRDAGVQRQNWKNQYREDSAEGFFVVLLRDVVSRVWATGGTRDLVEPSIPSEQPLGN